jgi:Zn-dependent protease/predicted transcriptional regulator
LLGYRITIFRLYGFDIHVDVSWFVLSMLIMWSLAVNYFPSAIPGLANDTYWHLGIAGLLGLCFSVIMHEIGHALVAKYFRMKIGDITLWIFGGIADLQEERNVPKHELLMALAGPAMSVALAGMFYVCFVLTGGNEIQTPLTALMAYLVLLNIVLATFNMIPAFPLDGGRVLRAVLWHWKRDRLWATRMAGHAGSALACLLAFGGTAQVMHGNMLGGLWWFLLAIMITATAGSSIRDAVTYSLFTGHPVSRYMRRDVVTVSPSQTLEDLVDNYVYQYYLKTYPVVLDGKLIGRITVDDFHGVDRRQWPWKTVADFMRPVTGDTIIGPQTDAADAIAQMRKLGEQSLIVVRDHEFVGTVAMTDLLRLLSIKMRLEPDSVS